MAGSYNCPAKNTLRQAVYTAWDDAALAMRGRVPQPPVALYLPGEENLEALMLATRGFHPVGAERDARTHAKLQRATASALTGNAPVFQGTLKQAVLAHAAAGGARASLVNADFEGTMHGVAEDLLAVFSVFPATPVGVLAVTTFASRDDRTIQDGLFFASLLDAAVDEDLWPIIDQSAKRWRAYGRRFGNPDDAWHAQAARDIALLWRLCLGLGLVEHPQDDPGWLREGLWNELRTHALTMLRSFERIKNGGGVRQMPRLCSPGLGEAFASVSTPLSPMALQRWVSHGRDGNNRMTTTILTLRHGEPVSWAQACRQLVSLYAGSPIRYVDDDGRVHTT